MLWFQNTDDIKNKKQRNTFYEKYKIPIFVASLVGLILNLPELLAYSNPQKEIPKIPIIIEELGNFINDSKPVITINDIPNPFLNKESFNWTNGVKDLSDQQIFTELPDF